MPFQSLSKAETKQINPITLAFLGDAVFSLWVRDKLVRSGVGKAADFQRAAGKVVSAQGQSAFLEKVLPLLTEEEEEIYRRGRNAKKATKSKNASALDYNRSTGFEAVLGFLYLSGEMQRIENLLSLIDEENLKGQAANKPFKP